MPPSRRVGKDDAVADDYPSRPTSETSEETRLPETGKYQLRKILIFCFVYFSYGLGINLYGPLYPRQAGKNGLNSQIYGSVIATRYFICIVVYPLACRMVASMSSRLSTSVSIFTIGACEIMFGTLVSITGNVPFIILSFAIEVVGGIGMSILLSSTVIIGFSGKKDLIQKMSLSILVSFSLGLAVSPIIGVVSNEFLGFDKTFYIIGSLIVLIFILTAILLPEPDQQVAYEDVPIIFWMKDKRMIIYFFIMFATFVYSGFITVCLDHILKKFHLKRLYAGLIFSILPLAWGLTIPGWSWLIKKRFNSVMKIFIGSLLVLGSLILLGPLPFIPLDASVTNVCVSLFLAGLGIACKSACVIQSSEKDLRNLRFSEIQQLLIRPTLFSLSAYFGHFAGSLTAGFTDYYIGYRKTTLILFGLEIVIAVTAVVFALNRNYISNTQRGTSDERQQILET